MINSRDLSRCIDILSELNANANNKRDKSLILELGYIIKQELDLVDAWEKNHKKQGKTSIDIDKLLEDNTQLFRENETLTKNIITLKTLVEEKIPAIEEELSNIRKKFNTLNYNLMSL